MYTQLEKYLKARTEIDGKTLAYISSYFKFKKMKRTEFLLKEGEICSSCRFRKIPEELPTPPRPYIEKSFTVIHWTEISSGGHFAAIGGPILLADDIKKFFKSLT